jgi:hypothetical protein
MKELWRKWHGSNDRKNSKKNMYTDKRKNRKGEARHMAKVQSVIKWSLTTKEEQRTEDRSYLYFPFYRAVGLCGYTAVFGYS